MSKVCPRCNTTKENALFSKDRIKKDGLSCYCKECSKEYNKEYRTNHPELKSKKKKYWIEYRLKVLNHYSNGELKCTCCGEDTYEFLSIDHVNGGGNQHRKELGSKYIYSWLIQNDYPEGYQVLCHNCNMAKAFYGECPHKRKLVEEMFDETV